MNPGRIEQIEQRLRRAFSPDRLNIRDDSAKHAGHAGARDGAGHYSVSIRAEAFRGRNRLERHRLVYEALADLMPRDIHALSIDAAVTDERN